MPGGTHRAAPPSRAAAIAALIAAIVGAAKTTGTPLDQEVQGPNGDEDR